MTVATPTIVPANRLGQLLSEARLSVGGDLEAYASRSEFTVGELSDIEAGHRLLNESLVRRVSALYEVDCGPVIPERSRLTIDLTGHSVSIAGEAVQLESVERDHILDRYLSLVYVLRNTEPGTEIPLRDSDVAILSASLAEREELIIGQLQRSMEQDGDEVRGLAAWFRRRLWVPQAGMLVGVVSIGSLVMIAGDAPADVATSETLPDPEPSPAGRGLILPQAVELTHQVASSPETSTPADQSELVTSTAQALPKPVMVTEVLGMTKDAETPEEVVTEFPDAELPEVAPEATLSYEEQLGLEAEALLPFDIEAVLPGWDVRYLGPQPGHRGLTLRQTKVIEIYVRPSDSASSLAGILAHELGHAVDLSYFNDEARLRWFAGRGLGVGTPWWPGSAAPDFRSGAGDFAEAFAHWAIGDPSSSQIGGPLDQADIALLETLLPSALQR